MTDNVTETVEEVKEPAEEETVSSEATAVPAEPQNESSAETEDNKNDERIALLEEKVAEFTSEKEYREAEEEVKKDFERIREIFPEIKEISEIASSDYADRISSLVEKGYSLFDAFVTTNIEKIIENAAKRSKRKTLNEIAGKSHLTPSPKSDSDGGVEIPPDVLAAYKAFDPNASDSDIRRHYNEYIKNRK